MNWFNIGVTLLIIASCNQPANSDQLENEKVADIPDTAVSRYEKEYIPKKDSMRLFAAWLDIIKALQKNDLKLLAKNTFDSIYCQVCQPHEKGIEVEKIPILHIPLKNFGNFYADSLLYSHSQYFPDSDSSIIDYFVFLDKKPKDFWQISNDSITIYRMRFHSKDHIDYSLSYRFIKINEKFKFIGLYY